jgi:hypothetical protein
MEEMTTEEARKGWGPLLDSIHHRRRGIVRLRRYRTPYAALVPVDWMEKAVAAIGEPPVAQLPPETPAPGA